MTTKSNQNSEQLVKRIIDLILDKKGEDIAILDLRELSSFSDFFVIATGSSSVHVKAVADEIQEKLKKEDKTMPWHTEGYEAQKWILLDYVDVVVHIFDKGTREYYKLEKLWEDAEIQYIDEM
ncbi:ribosome silencing factor [Candidatus Latescibacterota bacterium]